jgi:ferritin-like metal-binding protein YciE
MDTAKDLFEHELRDVYDAEHKQVKALESMAGKVTNEELVKGFKQHQQETEGQIQRLEKVFELVDRAPRREACEGINGLISEFTGFVKDESPAEPVLNVFAAASAIKAEYYEINSYKSLIKLADLIGINGASELLEQNLREEIQTAELLETMSDKLGQEVPVS